MRVEISEKNCKAGEKLMETTKSALNQLGALLPKSDLQYQMIADKLGLEILQCGIDYFNGSDDDDAPKKATALPLPVNVWEVPGLSS